MTLLKFCHVFFAFLWIACLLLISKYMAMQKTSEQAISRISKKIYLTVDLPAMLFTIILGILQLVFLSINWKAPWLHLKLTAVGGLILCDIALAYALFKKPGAKSIIWQLIYYITAFLLLVILFSIYVLKYFF